MGSVERRLRAQYIRKASEFNELFQEGQRFSSRHFIVFSRASEMSQFGLAVSRRIKTAVARNRAKRRTREIMRKHLNRLPRESRLVLVAKPGVERVRFATLEAQVVRLLGLVEAS